MRAVQAFELRLTAELLRWPDRAAEELGYDQERAWLLLADAGRPVGDLGNPPEAWLAALPRHAERSRQVVPGAVGGRLGRVRLA